MLKFYIFRKGVFSVQNRIKNWFCCFYTVVNQLNITAGLHKTIFIVSLAFILTLFIESCKTCKCPAYSYIESQKPANSVGLSVQNDFFPILTKIGIIKNRFNRINTRKLHLF
jgi:hypothetical protein